MGAYILARKLVHGVKCHKTKRNNAIHLNVMFCHCVGESESYEESLPYEWYEKVFPKLTRMSQSLKNVDVIDGQLVNVNDDSIIIDDRIRQKMHTFKSLARVFIGSPSVQKMLKENVSITGCFSKPNEREPMIVNSLTKVSDILNVTAQQRKSVRLTICPQVTQHRIWTGALDEILKGLKTEIDLLNNTSPSKGTKMGQQIVFNCLNFLTESAVSYDSDSTSWMRLAPVKVVDSPSRKWEDVLEMFNDLISFLESEKDLLYHVMKIAVMKEGLSQIKNVLLDKTIGYKEARHQESLVQKKLSKTLGHSSRCLFTLLLYYLYGHVRDIELDLCGGFYGNGSQSRFTLCMGRILTSAEENAVWCGIKQLDRALGLFKFVWETAGMKGVLELQGHLWSVGAEERSVTYRGNAFFLHGISLRPMGIPSKHV